MTSLLFITLILLIAGAGVAWLLRLSGVPGGRPASVVLAGVIVGVLAGPGIFGQVSPDRWMGAFRGGVDELSALRAVERQQEIDRLAIEASGVSEAYVDEFVAAHKVDLDAARQVLDAAQASHASMVGAVSIALGSVWILLVFSAVRIHLPRVPLPLSTVGPFLLIALVVGGLCVLAGPMTPTAGAIMAVLLLSPGVGLRTKGSVGRVTSTAAITSIVTLGAALAIARPDSHVLLVPFVVMLAGLAVSARWPVVARAAVLRGADHLAPGLIAFTIAMLDLHALGGSRLFWVAAVAGLIIASDGRWLLYWMALRCTGGCDAPWRAGALIVNRGSGLAALIVGGMLMATGAMAPALVAGLVIGAMVSECTRPLRMSLATWLDTNEFSER